jgi:hypothetical protein
MSKKKKFAGKKTKLAEHALTQVLTQESEAAQPIVAPSSSLTLAQAVQALRHDQLHLELPLSDGPPIPTQGQLASAKAYLATVQELEDIRELLRAPNLPARPRPVRQKPWSLPTPEIISYSLQVVNHTLRDIRTLMR